MRIIRVVLILLFTLPAMKAAAESSDYAIKCVKTSSGARISLLHRRTGRLVWMRTVDVAFGAGWSRNGKAVAVGVMKHERLGLLVWRAGRRPYLVDVPGDPDYTMGFLWSSDNRRVAVRLGGSGDSLADAGMLYCMNAASRRFSYVGRSVRKYEWTSTRRLRYWVVKHIERNGLPDRVVEPKPRVWTCP
jgi:hypothetical protein